METKLLTVDPMRDVDVVQALGSPTRIEILNLLRQKGPLNVNDIAAQMRLPQSTTATNLKSLEQAGLIQTQTMKATKGNQKVCSSIYDEILIRFDANGTKASEDVVTVSMPIGLFTEFDVGAPCGLCSVNNVIGMLDVQEVFLDPQRMQAALLWFTRGYVEYKFPNNAKVSGKKIRKVEFSAELSSETPATNANWPSDISIWVNGIKAGHWTSPGDYGDRRGMYSPAWWKLSGSQYGKLKTWTIDETGTWIDGAMVSTQTIASLGIADHHSIRFRIGIDEKADNPGGMNLFGKGFGDFDQDLVMSIYF
ncbi:putative transcriptional regulator [Rhizobium sp. BK529]|uniref:ArsR/SmtB family transcription factor n=1 Tax=unclassified Rhizobium TaxID=2613769 RepID=UPI001044E84D|nr:MULTISPECIES: ArsR family transcriptional regulator [unclassified Rhizobium]MBB3594002.1 putative transcriptional regulator [Rhizobium sp. BK529]TCS01458.1 ArsR family transcriptional regulator [Rhizobium sp. BK418]